MIYWYKLLSQLSKLQTQINKKVGRDTVKDPDLVPHSGGRSCRNLLRLLVRSRWVKLLIIGEILFSCQPLVYSYILDQQWRLALESLLCDQIIFVNGLKTFPSQNYKEPDLNIYKLFQPSQYMVINKLNKFFSQKNKLWILSNLFIEKKFFLSRLSNSQKTPSALSARATARLKTTLQKLCLMDIQSSLSKKGLLAPPKGEKALLRPRNKLILEYNNLIIWTVDKSCLQKTLDLASTRGLSIKYYPIDFSPMDINIRAHQKQFQIYLKYHTGPIDQILLELNQKISIWRHFYNSSKIMNDYFFWRIWFWLKKRHKNKGSKWLYKKYWNKSTSQKWIFSWNDQYLQFVQ
uniref:Uncharacterized protein n=1 Tax=Caulerpa cliftonii TaxID=1004391 RepID=A0A1C9JBS0_9CHLO|nr:hypothetical protein [Caulerpa cliftonii]AOP19305.1 hypothetical protein [Caulerpa cliftonii]